MKGVASTVGTFAVQIAKALGADVTAVCGPGNVERVRALGADRVIDYTRDDFTRTGRQYDLIIAANGSRSLWDYRRALTPTGRYVMTGGHNAQIFQALLLAPLVSRLGPQKMMHLSAAPSARDLADLLELVAAGRLTPVIDRCYPLSEAPAALRYLEAGHARGKIIITLDQRN